MRLSPTGAALRIQIAALSILVSSFTAWAGHRSAEEARPRIEHHLQQVDMLSQHFAGLLKQNCQHFDRPEEWRTFLDGELDRATLLVAHLEQAWVEAKHTGDKGLRRAAKAPRGQVDRAQRLVSKLQACAGDNGTSFDAAAAWQRVERDVPRRQAEIALPQ
jgi:hypothetical protein